MNRTLIVALLFAAGCSSMTPGKLAWVQPNSDRPHAGNVYLLRGWIGIFSYGINQLGDKLNAAGVRSSVYQENQWLELADAIKKQYRESKHAEPLILVGHSFGADDTLKVSRVLAEAGITVDLVVTLDPVNPTEVPANVKRVCNLYQSNGAWDKLPLFRGVPLKAVDASRTKVANLDIRKERTDLLEPGTDHFNIEKKGKVHAEVLRQVLAECPGRGEWARLQKAQESKYATEPRHGAPATRPAVTGGRVARTDATVQ